MAAVCSKTARACPWGQRTASVIAAAAPLAVRDAAQAQAPPQRQGCTFAGFHQANLAPPLAPDLVDGGISHFRGEVWSDPKTKGNIIKAIRALKLHVLKTTSNVTSEFLGAGSKTITLVFLLKKLPSNRKALLVPLPHPLAYPTEGLFVRTATGKKILSVAFGNGDMEVDVLAKNAMAVTMAVRKSKVLDTSLVREATVEVDRLVLPFWNRELWNKGKHGRLAKSSRHAAKKKASMGPPVGPSVKKAKLI